MKYYTKIIPSALAEELKTLGIHQLKDNRMEGWLNSGDNITYAEVFDWLMEKRIYIDGYPIYHITNKCYTNEWCFNVMSDDIPQEKEGDYESFGKWHEAANAAIEKALELVKED